MNTFIAALVIAQPVQYQKLVFDPSELNGFGQITEEEATCVASTLTGFHPSYDENQFLGVNFARQDSQRSRVCLTYTAEVTSSVDDILSMETEPRGVSYSADGTVGEYPIALETVCVARGLSQPLLNCLSAYYPASGASVVQFRVRRDRPAEPAFLTRVWVRVNGNPNAYGQDRRNGLARPFQSENPPVEVTP